MGNDGEERGVGWVVVIVMYCLFLPCDVSEKEKKKHVSGVVLIDKDHKSPI